MSIQFRIEAYILLLKNRLGKCDSIDCWQVKQRVMQILNMRGGSIRTIKSIMRGKGDVFYLTMID